jgi:hypothetical protein
VTKAEPPDEAPNLATEVPAPRRPPATRSAAIKLIAGLLAITVGLAVLLIVSVVAMILVDESAQGVVAVDGCERRARRSGWIRRVLADLAVSACMAGRLGRTRPRIGCRG